VTELLERNAGFETEPRRRFNKVECVKLLNLHRGFVPDSCGTENTPPQRVQSNANVGTKLRPLFLPLIAGWDQDLLGITAESEAANTLKALSTFSYQKMLGRTHTLLNQQGALVDFGQPFVVNFATSPSDQGLKERFERYTMEWKEEGKLSSSVTEICMSPAYQKIIGMGPRALPLIFESLERELGHWFWALRAITDVDPVLPTSLGNLNAMRDDWLKWWRHQ